MLTDKELLLEDDDDGRKFNAQLRKVTSARGKERKFIVSKKSDAAQALLTHKRRPLRLDNHKFFIPVYDVNSKMMLLKCSRQVGKSVSLCNMILIESMAYAAFRTLYVSPSSMQTRQFSNEKLTPTINDTPLIKKYYQDKNCIQQVYEKTLTNAAHIFLRYAFLSPDRARGIPADRLCFDKNAFVLTMSGWKSVVNLKEDDLVADVNDDGAVEWSHPYGIFKKKHSGKMVTFKRREFEIRVTEDHLMWANFRMYKDSIKQDVYEFVPALDLAETSGGGFRFTCDATWNGDPPEFAMIDGVDEKRRHEKTRDFLRIPYGPFSRLVGWYIAEGHIGHYSNGDPYAIITQSKNRHLDDIVEIIENCGLKYSVYGKEGSKTDKSICIRCLHLGHYFEKLGKSRSKYIPREFFKYPALLENVLECLFLGDAAICKGKNWKTGTLTTRSFQLAEDVQEAFLRLGRCASIKIDHKVPRHQDDPSFKITAPSPMYRVCSYNVPDFNFFKFDFKKRKRVSIEEVKDETVYCFSVKNHRPIVKGNVRSGGIITGQCIDELQDILKDSVKVIAECLSFSKFQYELYAGTPKSHDNTIEEYWGWSDQMEWAVPCEKHSPVHYNILGTSNIGKNHLICDKCGGQIYPESGQWVVTNPGGEYTGFHVTQLMVPWKQGEDEWKKQIIFKYENWPEATFHNEVLGNSHDQASKPITQTEIIQCCHPINKQIHVPSEHLIMEPNMDVLRRPNYAGVDWGEGRGEGKVEGGKKRHASWTVLTIGTFINENLFWPYFIKRYTGKEIDPEFIKQDVVQLCNKFKVRIIGADWGHGWGMNSHLINRLGRDRVMEFQYVAKLRERIRFDKLSFTFRVNRSMAISNFITSIKEQGILFPVWEEFKPFAKDILGIYVDYNERMKTMYYDHPIDQPDDAMHSLIYARLAGLISMGKY